MRPVEHRSLVRCQGSTLSIRRQYALPDVARSGMYQPLAPANDDDLALMRRIDAFIWTVRSTVRGASRRP